MLAMCSLLKRFFFFWWWCCCCLFTLLVQHWGKLLRLTYQDVVVRALAHIVIESVYFHSRDTKHFDSVLCICTTDERCSTHPFAHSIICSFVRSLEQTHRFMNFITNLVCIPTTASQTIWTNNKIIKIWRAAKKRRWFFCFFFYYSKLSENIIMRDTNVDSIMMECNVRERERFSAWHVKYCLVSIEGCTTYIRTSVTYLTIYRMHMLACDLHAPFHIFTLPFPFQLSLSFSMIFCWCCWLVVGGGQKGNNSAVECAVTERPTHSTPNLISEIRIRVCHQSAPYHPPAIPFQCDELNMRSTKYTSIPIWWQCWCW